MVLYKGLNGRTISLRTKTNPYLCHKIYNLELKELRQLFAENDTIQSVFKQLDKPGKKVHLRGLIGSSKSMYASLLSEKVKQPVLYVLNDKEEASYFYDDLISLGTASPVLFFPASYKRSIQYGQPEQENIIQRTEALNQIREAEQVSIVTYPEALAEKVITSEVLSANSFPVKIGDKLSIEFLNDVLFEYGFERVDFVVEPGQYSIRGSIIDIYSFAGEDPYRLDFFGDEIDTIRSFDIDNQISKEKLDKIVIIPNIQTGLTEKKKETTF